MARVTLLRRQAEDYAKQHAAYSEQLAAYNAAGEKYNAMVDQVKAGAMPGLYPSDSSPGTFQVVQRDKYGQLTPQGPRGQLVDSIEKAPPADQNLGNSPVLPNLMPNIYVRNPDGLTATMLESVADGTTREVKDVEGNITQVENYKWVPSGGSVGILQFDQKPPEADPRLARGPNFTMAEEKLLENPAYDQSGVALAEAYGVPARSEIAGMEEAGRNSPFFNLQGDDPKGIKGKGILAQVLGGYTP